MLDDCAKRKALEPKNNTVLISWLSAFQLTFDMFPTICVYIVCRYKKNASVKKAENEECVVCTVVERYFKPFSLLFITNQIKLG